MQELQTLIAEASQFKYKRSCLAQNLRNIDIKFDNKMEKLKSEYLSKINSYEAERQSELDAIASRAKDEMDNYVRTDNTLQKFFDSAMQWCPKSLIADYIPNPTGLNESEINSLLRMLREQGVTAWFKRTFKLDGYSSRSEMALYLCQKIEDARAYCNAKIASIQSRAEQEKGNIITDIRRKTKTEQENHKKESRELEIRQSNEREKAITAINEFDNSVELKQIHSKVEHMRSIAENSCGLWGEYTAPTKMPEQLFLCEVNISLPNYNGIDEKIALPIWINLYECNIIVITSSNDASFGTDSKEKTFVRKMLARMLKTIPPENCSYSIFDSLHKGASLERLVDVTNIGTTDLMFDLFTSDEYSSEAVSCAERRKYLRNKPTEINKFIAGRNKSLFEYNKENGSFDYPFSWYIDFNFPSELDSKYLNDIMELFVNATAAGYSFVFVTSLKGYDIINSLAKQYTKTNVIHIDVDESICKIGDLEVPYLGTENPSSEQVYNFMTALKKYYEDGISIDNRIKSVYSSRSIEIRNASKKLTIPMALDCRGRLVNLELGGDGSVHGFISGGTNSGKSTLLHTIILSACLHYHPKDLEIWLIDYKQTEFHLYKKKAPPHVKLIGVSKTAEFTFSLLDKIESEANRRTELMKHFDVRDLEEYRKHVGEPGYENIPRLFIIIDEFHEMSQFVALEPDYLVKLENILREYRSQGITCLMADQTFSTGLKGLTVPAKNQIGLRIAMRNEASIQEIKETLDVDRAMYSDSMQHTIQIMSQGDFIMKVYIRNSRGELTDIKLEKFKGLLTKGDDISPISKALRSIYQGQFSEELLYVNTNEQVYWDDSEAASLDLIEPLRYPNVRLYLGRSATLRPCFGIDIGRQPNENLSIVGGTANQRWELIASIMKSCKYRNYKIIVFMAEYSDLMSDFGNDIRNLCNSIPNVELLETMEEWCGKLNELDAIMDNRGNTDEIICVFIGLEIANIEMERLPNKLGSEVINRLGSIINNRTLLNGDEKIESDTFDNTPPKVFNATSIIDKLFSIGARNGIRCVAEVSVYRQFSKILKIKEMCRHKIAFSMSADDCLMYLGNSSFQKKIGHNAIYGDGGKEVKMLIPYKL